MHVLENDRQRRRLGRTRQERCHRLEETETCSGRIALRREIQHVARRQLRNNSNQLPGGGGGDVPRPYRANVVANSLDESLVGAEPLLVGPAGQDGPSRRMDFPHKLGDETGLPAPGPASNDDHARIAARRPPPLRAKSVELRAPTDNRNRLGPRQEGR